MTSNSTLSPTQARRGELAALCMALGADQVGEVTAAERGLLEGVQTTEGVTAERARTAILSGQDFLGDLYSASIAPEERRPLGQTFTPQPIIATMMGWASAHGTPTRVVDPGAGSGRYAIAAALAFPDATVVASGIDPLATLMTRANAAVLGVGNRVRVVLGGGAVDGPTLFIGNPPYVRHLMMS